MIPQWKIYPRSQGHSTVYLQNVVTDPSIVVGEYTTYDDFVRDPRDFQKNNVLYHYPVNHERLSIGKFCSIACGARFLFNSANHALGSLSTYPFPIFFEEWGLDVADIPQAWDNQGGIVVGNDVWIGYEAVILKRFSDDVIEALLELRWWDWRPERIAANLDAIQSGDIRRLT